LQSVKIFLKYKNPKNIFIKFSNLTLGKISKNDSSPKPIVILPICSHTNGNQQLKIIKKIKEAFTTTNGILVNIATDGDACRRRFLKSVRMNILDKNCPLYSNVL
jgi:hypothetical protein